MRRLGIWDLRRGGRAVEITAPPYTHRRTVYARIDRVNLDDLFATFDFPSPTQSSLERPQTLVPQQALYGMNDGFVIDQARVLARQLSDITEGQVRRQRLTYLYQQLFQRKPTPQEFQLASEFLENAKEAKAPRSVSGWQYGFGSPDPKVPADKRLQPFPYFDAESLTYRFSKAYPHPTMHHLRLSKIGGHTGKRVSQSPIRRWTAPYSGTFKVRAELNHPHDKGDGVRGRIISSRQGVLQEAIVFNQIKELKLAEVKMEQGDSLDFVVDCGETPTADGFRLTVTIGRVGNTEYTKYDEPSQVARWNSQSDFSGPALPTLNIWEQLTHALFMTNEFLFVE